MLFALLSLSASLTAAHFLRMGFVGEAAACLLILPLSISKRAWVLPVIRGAIFLFLVISLETLIEQVRIRQFLAGPWIRLLLILGGVAAVHIGGLVCLYQRKAKARYAAFGDSRNPSAAAFLLTFGLLAAVLFKAPGGMLLLGRFVSGGEWTQAFLSCILAAFITEKMLHKRSQPIWRRRIWMLFSAVFFVQLGLGLLGFDRFLMSGTLHAPVPAVIAAGPIFRHEGFFMPILFGTTILLVGPAWCSHLCYFGAPDNLLADRKRSPSHLPRWTSTIRFTLFFIVIATAVAFRLIGMSSQGAAAAALGFGVMGLAVMFVFSLKIGAMAHCTLFCPLGFIANALGKLSPFRIRIDSGCIDCGRCTVACRYNALSKEDIQRRRPGFSCSCCGDCIHRCESNQIGYRFVGISGENVRTVFIVMVVSIWSVFLVVARI